MTQDQISTILGALEELRGNLAELHAEVGVVKEISSRTEVQATRTNGRVSKLEIDASAIAAREDERRKVIAETALTAVNVSTQKSRRIDRLAAACTGAGLVTMAALLQHFLT